METVESLKLELLKKDEEIASKDKLIEENNNTIISLRKTNTELYDRVTVQYKGEEPEENEEDKDFSMEDFTNKLLGGNE